MPNSRRKQAVQEFWRTFYDHRHILAIPDNNMETEMMTVLQALKRVETRLHYHVGYHDDGADLLLSAEGHVELSPTIAECISHAPSCAGWRFRPILDSESLFGKRNYTLFPDDENGDVLFDIAASGGDLITPKEVDFINVFPSELAARSFASELLDTDEVTVETDDDAEGFPWEVCVTRKMVPTHNNITAHETRLASLAARHGGRANGWGFVSN